MIKRVLVPVDFSKSALKALDYALGVAKAFKAEVVVLHVVEPVYYSAPDLTGGAETMAALMDEQRRLGRQQLLRLEQHYAKAGTRLRGVLQTGTAYRAIGDAAQALKADLIVMGTHGRGGFDRLVLGSVTEKVLRKATGPVLTVPPAVTSAPDGAIAPFKNILCAIDFSPASLRALTYALSLAQESGKRLILLHVFDWPVDRPMPGGLGPELAEYRRHSQEQAERELHAAVPEAARAWCECTEVTAVGRPHETITRIARERGADLIVLGVHGRNAVELALFGSTTHQVVRHATCPVLTIRP